MRNDLDFCRSFFRPFGGFYLDISDRTSLLESEVDWNYGFKKIYSQKNIKDENGELSVMEIPVPGYSKEDIKISILSKNVLQVEGENKSENKNFSWKTSINENYDLSTLKAECKNGVLKISLRLLAPRVVQID